LRVVETSSRKCNTAAGGPHGCAAPAAGSDPVEGGRDNATEVEHCVPRRKGGTLGAYGAVRPAATNASYVTGIRSAKKRSHASAYRRISRCAISEFRSERKFMSARALTVQ
jgi:hypothetical protein